VSRPERTQQPARSNSDFADRVLVDCPGCGRAALVELRETDDEGPARRRLACGACGRAAEGPADDISLGQPLSLRAETRFGTLLAYNLDHLDYIEAFIQAGLREERVDPDGPRNRSILSRLPAWAKSAKNRDEVLRAIARARKRLG
jgi:hypothetical protein